MHLHFTDRESYREKQTLFNKFYADDNRAYFIDEGGASPEAAKGCSELIAELPDTYHHILCACGTGTTAAGIINGIQQHNLSTQFHAVPALKNGGFLKDEIDKYLTAPAGYELHTDYHFGGYGKVTPELISFVKNFTASTGIMIEPVYTGKLFYALYDLIAKKHFARGSKILAIHTGGLLGILGMKKHF
jgi:1-aminocyclopropane-1-carboxylate deaminase